MPTGAPAGNWGTGAIEFALRRATNVVRPELKVEKAARSRTLGKCSCVLRMTGPVGARKSTVADRMEQKLHARVRRTFLKDGDTVRVGAEPDLGFAERDRVENIRRVAKVAKLLADAGLRVIVSLISPFGSECSMARDPIEEGELLGILVEVPLSLREASDPMVLYAKGAGAIS